MVIQNPNSNVTNPNLNLNTVNNSINDPLYIGNSDHPGMVLTNTPFNGSNFLGWSRTVKMALGVKLKLGFINGTCVRPIDDGEDLQRWIRCDYMVTCWLLNSMTAELSEAFLYAQSAFELWKEIAERYGQSNGPLIYQLQRELNNMSQGSLLVAQQVNKYWDELHNLNGVPVCSCGKMQECTCNLVDKFLEIEGRSKLVQFLMKLNDDYESVRNQILSMDPLPNVNKAYYIVQSKQVYRHSVEQCFEKIGYPDWYKGKKNKKGGKLAANMVFGPETPFDMGYENELQGEQSNPGLDLKLVAAVYQEVMKGKSSASTSRATPGYGVTPGFMHHAGTSFHVKTFALSSQSNIDRINEWIIVDPTLIDRIP
ncbi:pyridoxal 5'-phosphate synthase-like subunit PDX1.2 [Tanacetum coccineum]